MAGNAPLVRFAIAVNWTMGSPWELEPESELAKVIRLFMIDRSDRQRFAAQERAL